MRIAEAFGIPAISTGDVFRAAVADGTELGEQVKAIIEAGDLVPDELTSAVVRDRLRRRTPPTASCSTATRATSARSPTSTSSSRAAARASTPSSSSSSRATRASTGLPAARAEQGRTDDTEEVIANRLAIYERETAPILEVYRERGIVDEIDGVGSLDEITDRIFAALEARGLIRSPPPEPVLCAARSTSRPPSCGRWSSRD